MWSLITFLFCSLLSVLLRIVDAHEFMENLKSRNITECMSHEDYS